MFSEWVKLKAILFSNIQNSKKKSFTSFYVANFCEKLSGFSFSFTFHRKNILNKWSKTDLKISDQIRSNQIRSLSENAIWSDLRSLFYQMILIWSNIRILEIFQNSAAQNQFETMRYLASYPAGHPARHPAGHHIGCHLVRCFVGCLIGLGNDRNNRKPTSNRLFLK